MLTNALKILATHGWEKTTDASFGYSAIESLSSRFSKPLQDANVNSALLQKEWDDIVFHATQYINVVTEPYTAVWWKLYNSPDSPKWKNILALVELLFSLPLCNAQLERCFSGLKIIKTNRRSCLGEDRLENLLRIQLEGPQLNDWDAGRSVELWSGDKTCRINCTDSRTMQRKNPTTVTEDIGSQFTWNLTDWENWLEDDSESKCTLLLTRDYTAYIHCISCYMFFCCGINFRFIVEIIC